MEKKKYIMPTVIILTVIIGIGVICVSRQNAKDENISFPYELEAGKLELTSLFQSDIPNPDNEFIEGTNLASIELVNKSETYLEEAEISIVLEDGTKLQFQIEDIPADEKVWAFDLDNTSIEADSVCKSIRCEAEFTSASNDWTSDFQIVSEGAAVTLTNLTEEKQEEMKMVCHCLMEDTYFGGTSYEYRIEELLPWESEKLEVTECYFGDVQVVRISE